MQDIRVLSNKDLKPMFKYMEERFGVDLKNRFAYFMTKKDNVYAASRDVANIDYLKLNVNSIGFYVWEWRKGEVRFSIEGSQVVGPEAKKNIVELSKGLYTLWIAGYDLEFKYDSPGYVLIKYENDFVGCSRATGEKLLNFVPKSRRITPSE